MFSWQYISPSSESTVPPIGNCHASCIYKGKFYIFGGYNGSSIFDEIFEFNPNTLTWRKILDKNTISRRYCHAGAVYNDQFIIFGGWNGKSNNDVQSFDFISFSWKTLFPTTTSHVPQPRWGASMNIYGNSLYIFGGAINSKRFDDISKFDLDTLKWEVLQVTNRPLRRAYHSSVIYDNALYIFGGCDNDLVFQCSNELNDLWAFDLITNEWRQIKQTTNVPTPRHGHTCVLFKDVMTIFGGLCTHGYETNDMYQYDFRLKTWKKIDYLSDVVPSCRSSHSCAVFDNGNMIVFGGTNKRKNTNDVWMIRIYNTIDKFGEKMLNTCKFTDIVIKCSLD